MKILTNALGLILKYYKDRVDSVELEIIKKEIYDICETSEETKITNSKKTINYEELQKLLSVINEKEVIRKNKGVYYTPNDVVNYITKNCINLLYGESTENITKENAYNIPYEDFCMKKIVFDPTCGTGEFLLAALCAKFDEWDKNNNEIKNVDIKKIIATIKGNDINKESIIISKLRIYLTTINRYGLNAGKGISKLINKNFTTNDYVINPTKNKYDIVIGNPPYVEDNKYEFEITEKYGNIYANILTNSARNLKENGVFGFIIPLSYISTPRMKKLRKELLKRVSEQIILNYSDRPDCLFPSVHQKLSILLCKNKKEIPKVFTSNYQYWYKEERRGLFLNKEIIKNDYLKDEYIPKLGNEIDVNIYRKILGYRSNISLFDYSSNGNFQVFVNMRATFWIKAFRNKHSGSEYKSYFFDQKGKADFYFCILNSTLFWWFWITVSDCWHITKKELQNFFVPKVDNFSLPSELALDLETKLENTKKYVGTSQTTFEYKHKECIKEIQKIDDYVNNLFGLSKKESNYIKQFALNYRVSGGVIK